TAALGWENGEQPSFVDRATGAFDVVMMLAIVHHLLTDGVPLEKIIDLAARCTRDNAIIEYVSPADPRFRQVSRGRDHLYASVTADAFEAACRKRFDIVRREPLQDERR